MQFAQILRPWAIAGVLALSPSLASAATITLEKQTSWWFGSNGYAGVTITETTLRPGGLNVLAGGFALKGDIDGNLGEDNFTAWCLDIATFISLPSEYIVTDTPFTSDPLTSAQIGNIGKLFGTGFSGLDLTDNAQSAGFQLALWEIIYENAATFDLSSGNFLATNSAAAIAFGQVLLNGLGNSINQTYDLTFLESTPHVSQNFVTATPVPLPAAGFLLLSALGGLAVQRRRRVNA